MKYSLKEIEMLKQDREKCQRRVNRLLEKAPIKLLNAYQNLIHELDGELLRIAIKNDLKSKMEFMEIEKCKE